MLANPADVLAQRGRRSAVKVKPVIKYRICYMNYAELIGIIIQLLKNVEAVV